jgi:hypothetical protein
MPDESWITPALKHYLVVALSTAGSGWHAGNPAQFAKRVIAAIR